MFNKNYNNEFFGWQGTISRKDYIINLLIVFVLYIALTFLNFRIFEPYVPVKFLLTILEYLVEIFKIVLLMCGLSIIYRRITDFSGRKPYNFQLKMKRLFVFLYVIPTLYLLCIRYFFEMISVFIPIIGFMDVVMLFIILPLSFISAIVFSFIKGL